MQEILNRYNEIATGLNMDPPQVEPLFWEQDDGTEIAMDWCEGFMDAFALCKQQWDELLATEEDQDWMFPILAHLFDDDGYSLSGESEEELPVVLGQAAQLIPGTVPKIFAFWQLKRSNLQ